MVFIAIFSLIYWTHPNQSNAISLSSTGKMEIEEGQYPHLFNNKTTFGGMFAPAVPTGGNLYAHTEQYFPHFVGPDPKHLNLQDQDFISRQES